MRRSLIASLSLFAAATSALADSPVGRAFPLTPENFVLENDEIVGLKLELEGQVRTFGLELLGMSDSVYSTCADGGDHGTPGYLAQVPFTLDQVEIFGTCGGAPEPAPAPERPLKIVLEIPASQCTFSDDGGTIRTTIGGQGRTFALDESLPIGMSDVPYTTCGDGLTPHLRGTLEPVAGRLLVEQLETCPE